MQRPILTGSERAFLAAARRAVLATTAADGHARLVPVCFVVDEHEDELGRTIAWSPLDEKPKSIGDPRGLARVRDILARPAVTLLVDAWSEDWAALGWLRCGGTASLVEPGDPSHARVVRSLRGKYPQYGTQALEGRPVIRIAVDQATAWGAIDSGEPSG